jgi:TPR repeat protein
MKAAAASKAKQAGNRRFHSGDFAEAQALYSLGIEYDDAIPPQLLAQLYSNRSATHLKLQRLDAAEADAKCAADLAPLWGKPHLRLAEVYHAKCTYEKAVDELEIALGVGAAAQDHAVVSDARAKMDEYRLLKDAEVRDESQNMAYSSTYATEGAYKETMQSSAGLRDDQDPGELLDKILKMKVRDGPGLDRHVLLGYQALRDGRYQDAVREFLAAAVNGNAEGMYNYAVMVEAGRGVKKNVGEAVQWLERAAQVPVRDEGPPNRNQGIGEAMSALARHHQLGIYFPMNSAKAVELWQRAATLGSVAALNALGVLYAHGGPGRVPQDPLSRVITCDKQLRSSATKPCSTLRISARHCRSLMSRSVGLTLPSGLDLHEGRKLSRSTASLQ